MSKIEVNTIDVSTGSTITLGSSGKTVQIACGASTVGMGRTGTVDWCTTAKTSPFTATNGSGFFINTTSGAVTITLPSSPSAGDIIAIADYAGTFQTNNVTISRGGSKINGSCRCATLGTEGQSVTLVYVDGTRGWKTVTDSTANVTGSPAYIIATGGTVLTCGDHKTHVFTSDSTFQVTNAGAGCGSNTVDYFVVAGGGGGGTWAGGGGGAGGFRLSSSLSIPAPTMSPLISPTALPVSATSYPITVGAGGSKAPAYAPSPAADNGSNSIFSTITSAGGGKGGFDCGAGGNGGSGGGGGRNPPHPAGSGNTPPVSPPQGNNGSQGHPGPAGYFGGGGGGASSAGNVTPPSQNDGGPGGSGSYIADATFGPTAPSYGVPGPVSSTRYFAGGGGGGNVATGATTGGSGGGGASTPSGGADGTTNTGGGGGGAYAPTPSSSSAGASGAGGSGIVVIRYKFQN